MTMRWTGAALVAATVLVACSKQEAPRPPLDHGKDAVQAYARTLVANHATLLDSSSAPEETVRTHVPWSCSSRCATGPG